MTHVKIGKFSGNADRLYAMGKDGFLSRHPHLPNREKIWEKIEQVSLGLQSAGEIVEHVGEVLEAVGEKIEKVARKRIKKQPAESNED